MSSNGSSKRLEGFFAGKGFYIVLFLCAAVIGISAWMMATGNEAMDEANKAREVSLDNRRVETVILPPEIRQEEDAFPVLAEPETGSADPEAALEADAGVADGGELTQVWHQGDVMEVEAPLYVWPVQGELDRHYQIEELGYDVTLKDWRTHEGVDIAAAIGSEVAASHSGSVESITEDELYGTVLTLNHGDGSGSVYANLESNPAVAVGDWVEPGEVIGTVGATALCEIGQGSHLHFAITVDGQSVNPLNYLPA